MRRDLAWPAKTRIASLVSCQPGKLDSLEPTSVPTQSLDDEGALSDEDVDDEVDDVDESLDDSFGFSLASLVLDPFPPDERLSVL